MPAQVRDFIYTYAKMIAAHPEEISVELCCGDVYTEILIYAREVDAGRLIGKGGKVISACKNIAVSSKLQHKTNYKITVKTIDE